MRRSVLVAAAGAAALVSAFGAAGGLGTAWPQPAPAQLVAQADLDGDGVFDDLEARLTSARATARVPVIVRLDAEPTAARVAGLQREVGALTIGRRLPLVDGFSATVTRAQAQALARLPQVAHVEENAEVRALNDTAQLAFGVTQARVDAPGLDGDGDGNLDSYSRDDLVAAVIDSGIDAGHADLDEGKVLAFVNCLNGTTCAPATPVDDYGHGTHVAATLAGEGDARPDGLYRGVASRAALVGVKVLDSTGKGSMAGVVAGIEWAVANRTTYGIEALNLSLGSDSCSAGADAVSAAVDAAQAAGLVVVAAAGNSGPDICTVGSPGSAAGALTVGAMADTGVVFDVVSRSARPGFNLAAFSSRGPTADGRVKPDLVAPGARITSASAGSGTGYAVASGTSMAAPFVAGVALLMLDASPGLSPQAVRDAMVRTAVDWGRGGDSRTPGTTGPDIDYGAGRLDAYAALTAAGAPLATPPAAPGHVRLDGRLDATGAQSDHRIDVATTAFPVAATLVIPEWAGTPDFDLYVLDPSGAQVAASASGARQDEIGFVPAAPGGYTLRVRSFSGGGDYFVDVSAGLSAPAVSIGDASVSEGNAGTATAAFAVTLSAASATTASVSFATEDGTASGASDYRPAAGTVSFAPGETSKVVAVPVVGDTVAEPNESFAVALGSPANATLGDPRGIGTIVNDDTAPAGQRRTGAAAKPLVSIGARTIRVSRAGVARIPLSCARARCVGSVSVVARRRAVGSKRFALPRRVRRTVAVRLSPSARKSLARTGRLRATVVVRMKAFSARRTVLLRRVR